jgi:predicted nucleic acid-binding Zn ribbon protein
VVEARRKAYNAAYNEAHRKHIVRDCVVCGMKMPIHHGGPGRKYCSTRCRGRYERALAAEREAEKENWEYALA